MWISAYKYALNIYILNIECDGCDSEKVNKDHQSEGVLLNSERHSVYYMKQITHYVE
jgi:hypothetical protein